jgi:hypothetical protein
MEYWNQRLDKIRLNKMLEKENDILKQKLEEKYVDLM